MTNLLLHSKADKVCSGHGVCECGSCKCERGYSGKYCAECPVSMNNPPAPPPTHTNIREYTHTSVLSYCLELL